MTGELPAVAVYQLLGIRFTDIGEGHLASTLRTSDWLRDRSSDVAPGVLAYFGHSVLSGAVATLCHAGHRVGIIDYNMAFLRPARADGGELLGHAGVIHEAGGLLVTQGEIADADGNLVATGRQTALFIKRRPRGPLAPEPERVLATVLFTDIVGSTGHAEELGDDAWGRLLGEHHAAVRRQLETWKGKEVKTTGDGFLATFDSPARAVQCARGVRDAVRRLGLELRAGVHTGECEVSAGDVAGIAVHVAARIQAAAGPGEVLVSGTVRDLVAGSGLRFAERGRQALKGIEGEWNLFTLSD